MAKYTALPLKESGTEVSVYAADLASELGTVSDSSALRSCAVKWWTCLLHLFVFVSSISAGLLARSESKCSISKGLYSVLKEMEVANVVTEALVGEHSRDLTVRFDGSLSRDSPFKGPPSAKVDKLWEDLVPRESNAPPVGSTSQ